MPLSDSLLNIGVTAMQAAAPYLAIHTATPNASGSNQSTAARVAASWPTAANGDFGTLSNKVFSGGAVNGPAVALGFWSTPTVNTGVFYGYLPLSSGQTFTGSGGYTVTSVTIPGTAT